MPTLSINLTRSNAVIGYGYSTSPNNSYMSSDWFKVGQQGPSAKAYSIGVMTIKDSAFLALQGKGHKIESATLKAYSYSRGNEWSTKVPIQVDGCTTESVVNTTTFNTLPTANVTGVVTEVEGWNVYYEFDVTDVISAICSKKNNHATLILYQTTTTYERAKAFYVTSTNYPIVLTITYTESSGKLYVDNTWKNTTSTKICINNEWKNVINTKIYLDNTWKDV